ncbi:hypothetical protein CEXT_21121 [Caerostris extrusa]|uniref:Uncharacterized protein n=1 Tax=Caerostris extrusa TaxID=172846 RepID=A0AAV4W8P5_CAEEX|nr:hypothetical protein CEXT_21121 [Caerostris extrusa]
MCFRIRQVSKISGMSKCPIFNSNNLSLTMPNSVIRMNSPICLKLSRKGSVVDLVAKESMRLVFPVISAPSTNIYIMHKLDKSKPLKSKSNLLYTNLGRSSENPSPSAIL